MRADCAKQSMIKNAHAYLDCVGHHGFLSRNWQCEDSTQSEQSESQHLPIQALHFLLIAAGAGSIQSKNGISHRGASGRLDAGEPFIERSAHDSPCLACKDGHWGHCKLMNPPDVLLLGHIWRGSPMYWLEEAVLLRHLSHPALQPCFSLTAQSCNAAQTAFHSANHIC